MIIERLRLANLRCFASLELVPGPTVTWLVGGNGVGKTTILEAAHILSHGRSFRPGGRSGPRRNGTNEFVIHAEILHKGRRLRRLGLTRNADRWQARLDGFELTTLAPLFEVFPVVCFGPDGSLLVQGPADLRRSFLDWSVFHVEHASLDVWRKWRRALRQRNTLLRDGAEGVAFPPWEHELGALAGKIHAVRSDCLADLEPYVQEEARWLVPELGAAQFEYRPGWDVARGLAVQLADDRKRDRERGFTQRGAHRADWQLHFEHVARNDYLSRGQAKAVALVCALAQTRWLHDRLGEYPLLCLDDLESELDGQHAAKAVAWLSDKPLQAWLTSTRRPIGLRSDDRVFHVEHAGLTPAS